jgi:hypothetical protein
VVAFPTGAVVVTPVDCLKPTVVRSATSVVNVSLSTNHNVSAVAAFLVSD